MEADNMSKTEVKQLFLIEKLEQTVEKLENKLSRTENLNTEQAERVKNLELEKSKLMEENEELKKECQETLEQCQEHVDNIEDQNDELEKIIEELKTQILPNDEMLLYLGYKVDIILNDAFNNKILVLTPEYLKDKNFPNVFLNDKEFDGITTTNFKLSKGKDENNFALTKN